MGPATPPMSQIDRSGRPVEAHRRKEEADDDDRPWTQSIGEATAYWLCNHCRRELVAQDNRDLSDRLWSGQSRSARMIAETGLIAAAGRAVRVSYKRAWQLLDAMNRCFREPLVKSNKDGRSSGGAYLTSTGVEVLACYRALAERAGRGLCRRSLCTRPHRAVAFSAQ
jgi:molybdate transport repressor ModE-like protein